MSARDEARHLLRLARKEIRALEGMLDHDQFDEFVFGFHAQQAVEKALKSWLASLDLEYPRTHDLSLLLKRLGDAGQECQDLAEIIELNPFAVEIRYGGMGDLGEPLDRPETILLVRRVVDRVTMTIWRPGEIDP